MSKVSFENLFSINNKHSIIKASTSAVRCLKCFRAILVLPEDKNALTALSDKIMYKDMSNSAIRPYNECQCGNVGAMLDEQSTLRVYVEDIRTVHIGTALFSPKGDLVKIQYADYSETFTYVDSMHLKDTSLSFVPKVKADAFKRKHKKARMNDLVESLDLGTEAKGRSFVYVTKT